MCEQMWRGDDDQLYFCGNLRGHGGECQDRDSRLFFSETVVMI